MAIIIILPLQIEDKNIMGLLQLSGTKTLKKSYLNEILKLVYTAVAKCFENKTYTFSRTSTAKVFLDIFVRCFCG